MRCQFWCDLHAQLLEQYTRQGGQEPEISQCAHLGTRLALKPWGETAAGACEMVCCCGQLAKQGSMWAALVGQSTKIVLDKKQVQVMHRCGVE